MEVEPRLFVPPLSLHNLTLGPRGGAAAIPRIANHQFTTNGEGGMWGGVETGSFPQSSRSGFWSLCRLKHHCGESAVGTVSLDSIIRSGLRHPSAKWISSQGTRNLQIPASLRSTVLRSRKHRGCRSSEGEGTRNTDLDGLVAAIVAILS